MTIRPIRLPRTRDRMAALLSDPHSSLRREVHQNQYGPMETSARHLTTATLSWASSDMAALATAAGRTLDTVGWSTMDRPTATGLLVMDGGVGQLSSHYGNHPVDAISWGPSSRGLLLSLWTDRDRVASILTKRGAQIDPDLVPPLIPVSGHVLPVSANEQPVDEIRPEIRTLATTLAAAWHLMYQPKVADRSPATIDRKICRAYARANRPEPEVTIVDLCPLYRPTDPDHEPESEPGRYTHRWVVGGHWHRQAYGPGYSLRRRIWIADYIKGPEEAPLLVRERINVWRR